MTKTCIVKSCKQFSASEKWSIFRFPQTSSSNSYLERLSGQRREQWMIALGLEVTSRWRGKYVCGRHFISGKPAKLTETEALDWTPTLNLPADKENISPASESELEIAGMRVSQAGEGNSSSSDAASPSTTAGIGSDLSKLAEQVEMYRAELEASHTRYYNLSADSSQLAEQNEMYRAELEASHTRYFNLSADSSQLAEQVEMYRADLEASHTRYLNLSADSSQLAEQNEMYRAELEASHTRYYNLSEQLAMDKRDINFLVNDVKCKYYTGLQNYQVLKKLYMFLLPSLEKPYCSLSKDQIFVMTLTKLRLNTPIRTLAYDYGVSPTTISKYFHRTLYIIYETCRYALEPTPVKNLQRHTPSEFEKQYGSRRIFIVDCFEVRCETPGNLKAAAMHFSNYKKNETVKFLIAVHPDGTIGFISKGFAGRCSDREILKQSGFLDVLEANDVVLADKGFDVKDLIEAKKAFLNIPTFLRKKSQFLPTELEHDKQVTTLRIHVERVIGLIRNKYMVTSGVISVDSMARFQNGLNIVDLIVHVCCILCNFNKSII